jgi:hypothetical protein
MTHSRAVLRHRDGVSGGEWGHFPHFLAIDLRDQTGWLGREDSNLRMADPKPPSLVLITLALNICRGSCRGSCFGIN